MKLNNFLSEWLHWWTKCLAWFFPTPYTVRWNRTMIDKIQDQLGTGIDVNDLKFHFFAEKYFQDIALLCSFQTFHACYLLATTRICGLLYVSVCVRASVCCLCVRAWPTISYFYCACVVAQWPSDLGRWLMVVGSWFRFPPSFNNILQDIGYLGKIESESRKTETWVECFQKNGLR